MTCDLPDNFFSQSVGRKVPPKVYKTKRGRGLLVTDLERKMQEIFESRNNVVEFTLFCETIASMIQTLRELKTDLPKLFSGFTKNCFGKKNEAKARHLFI